MLSRGPSSVVAFLHTALLTLAVFTGIFLGTIPAAAAAPGPQDLADRTETWLQAELGVEPLHREVVLATDADLTACAQLQQVRGRGGCSAVAWSDRIALDAENYVGATDAARWPSAWRPDPESYQTLLHELLHRGTGADLLEEGLVDALAYDLLPAASRSVIGLVLHPRAPVYRAEVHLVRKASAAACGCSWRSRAARGLRRAWWAADDATRHAVIAAAIAPPSDPLTPSQ